LQRGYKVDTLQYWDREKMELVAEYNYDAIAAETPFPYRLQCPQSVVTRTLKPLVEKTGLGRVHFSHRLISFVDKGDFVEAIFETPEGIKKVEGSYLCGSDGSRSTVRKQLGYGFTGSTYEDRFLLIPTSLDLRPHLPGLKGACYFFSPEEWVIVLHLPDLTRVVFRVHENEDIEAIQKHDSVRARINRFLQLEDDYEIYGTSVYRVHQRVVSQFREGRVILLGDSAHLNNPLGGMGMNSGIHDAYHLAPKLKAVCAGADDALLDVYSQERREAAIAHVHVVSDKNYNNLTAKKREERQKRDQELRAIAADPKRCREYLLRASMLEARI